MTAQASHALAPEPARRVDLRTVSLRDLATAGASFWRDNALGMAGMIAFFAFLALLPLVLLLLAFVGNVLSGWISANDIEKLFHDAVPGLTQKQFLSTYWEPVQHSKVTTRILGVISLLVGTTGLHDAVDWSVNRIWNATAKRPFWLAKLRGLAVIVWVIVFAVSSLWLTWLSAVLLGAAHAPGLVVAGLLSVLPSFVLDVAILGALYKLTPTCHVDPRSALVGGVVAAALWELTKVGFGWWVLQVGTYNRVYGPLAASVIVMLWLWMTAVVFLFGAELAAANQRRRTQGRPAE